MNESNTVRQMKTDSSENNVKSGIRKSKILTVQKLKIVGSIFFKNEYIF